MAESDRWDFEYVPLSSQAEGHHILDDVDLFTIPRDTEPSKPSAEPVAPSITDPNETSILQSNSSALNISSISDSSHTTFRSTVSHHSITKTPLTSVLRKRKHDELYSSGSSGSGGSQAVSTTYSLQSKKRKLIQADNARNDNQHDDSSITFLSQQSYPSNPSYPVPVHDPSTQLSLHSANAQHDILSFNSDIMDLQEIPSQPEPLHNLRWPSHIYSGNTSICIRLKGVYHPASIETVTKDLFVVKLTMPRTGTMKCVRFTYDDYKRDTDRVISMVNASQLTQTQSQRLRDNDRPSNLWGHSSRNVMESLPEDSMLMSNANEYDPICSNPLDPLNSSIVSIARNDENGINVMNANTSNLNLSNLSLSENDISAIPDVLGLNDEHRSDLDHHVEDGHDHRDDEVIDQPIDENETGDATTEIDRNEEDEEAFNESNTKSKSPVRVSGNPMEECESQSAMISNDNRSKDENDGNEDVNDSEDGVPTTKVVRITYRRCRSRRSLRLRQIKDYMQEPADTEQVTNSKSTTTMDKENEEKAVVIGENEKKGKKKKVQRKKKKVVKGIKWTKEEEEALMRGYKKYRNRKAPRTQDGRFPPGVFSHILEDEELKEIFAKNKRTRRTIKCKWRRMNGKLKLIEKWDKEEKGTNDIEENGKLEEDASD